VHEFDLENILIHKVLAAYLGHSTYCRGQAKNQFHFITFII